MIEIVSIAPTERSDPTPGEIERHKGDGRPKIWDEAGEKGRWYSRPSNAGSILEDNTNLMKWKLRLAVLGALRTSWLAEKILGLADPGNADKRTLDGFCATAQELAGSDLKSALGTALHDITERIDKGVDPGFIPPEYEADVAAYRQAMAESGLTVLATETFVVEDFYGFAGTFDKLVLRWNPERERWELKIADTKTGRVDYGWAKMAVQLAIYSRGKRYDPVTYARTPLTHTLADGTVLTVDQDEAYIIHLPEGQGRCEILPIDIAKGWEGLALARSVKDWRNFWQRKGARKPALVSIQK